MLMTDVDLALRDALREALEDAGHVVFETFDTHGAVAILRGSPQGMVVLAEEWRVAHDDAELLPALARACGPQGRHACLLLSDDALARLTRPPALDALMAGRTLRLPAPFELDALLDAADRIGATLARRDALGWGA
jgi:hypothetical protein